jgi:hypothetical protein
MMRAKTQQVGFENLKVKLLSLGGKQVLVMPGGHLETTTTSKATSESSFSLSRPRIPSWRT